MWKEYNPNPLGKRVGDCVIRAISAAENLSWFDAYDVLTHYGRLLGNLPNANDVWGAFLRDNGYTRHIIPDTCPDCYTFAAFCRDHPKGIYVLGTGTHTATVKFGDLYDAWDSSAEVPTFYWEAQHDL